MCRLWHQLHLCYRPRERSDEELRLVADELDHIRALAQFSSAVRRELASVIMFEKYAHAGTILFSENDEAHSWYIILDGSVNVVVQRKGVVCTLSDGDDFGKLCLTNPDALRAMTIVLRTDNCQLLRVNKSDFNR